MMGIRVSELAKEIEMSNADMVNALSDLGVPVPGPAAIVDADAAQIVREMYGKKNGSGKVVEIPLGSTVKDLATAMGVAASDVQEKLMAMGVLAAINQRLSIDAANKLAGVC